MVQGPSEGSRPPTGKTSLPALLAAKSDSPSAEISSLPSHTATRDSKLTAVRAARAQEGKDFSTSELELLDAVAFECRHREIGGQSQQSDGVQEGELSALVAATHISHCFDTLDWTRPKPSAITVAVQS